MKDSTTPVAIAWLSSAACTVTGWAPTSSAMRPVAGLALRRPGHRVQQHHALLAELLLQQRLLRRVELERRVVAVGQEGQAVDAEDRPLVGEVGQQDLAGLRLAALDRALDLRRLEQRGAGMHGDLQLPVRGLGHVVGELLDVDRVEVVRRVGGGQIPGGLGLGGAGREGGAQHQGLDEGRTHGHS